MSIATCLPEASLPVCDCHFHVFNAGGRAAEARYAPVYAASLADWEAQSSPSEVTRGVVVQPSFLDTDNSLLLTTLAQRPRALRGVAVVPASVTAAELQSLYAGGVRGIRLNLMGVADDVQTIRNLSVSWWSALITAGLHIELHAEIGRIASLLPIVPQSITTVLDHFAKPHNASLADETVQAVSARQRAGGDTYVTLSGAYRLGAVEVPPQKKFSEQLAGLWRDLLGRDRLLWGSDWPCTNHESDANYAALRATLNDWLPETDDRQAALQTNPQRLYWR